MAKSILVVIQSSAVGPSSRSALFEILRKHGFDPIMLAVTANEKAVDVFGLDHLTEIEMVEIRKLIENKKVTK